MSLPLKPMLTKLPKILLLLGLSSCTSEWLYMFGHSMDPIGPKTDLFDYLYFFGGIILFVVSFLMYKYNLNIDHDDKLKKTQEKHFLQKYLFEPGLIFGLYVAISAFLLYIRE